MKATTIYLCVIALGVAVGIVAVVQGPVWLAITAWAGAYAAAGAYRHSTRPKPARKKGAGR